jgi:transcriptional regulator with XRE-family HTH domain
MLTKEEKLNSMFLGLGERLKAFRQSKGFKQAPFADICGIDRNNLSKIENGRRGIPDFMIYNLFMNFPDFDANYIITGRKNELKMAVTEGVEH